jgi:probable rRNA maturation factor
MRLSFHLEKKVTEKLSLAFFKQIARAALLEGLPASLMHKSFVLSAVAVSLEEIQTLNQTYRGKNAPTDILSFWNFSNIAELEGEKNATIDLGELFFAPCFIKQAAREDGVEYRREMAYVFSHGVLHLVGYDHEPEMFRIQDRITDTYAPLAKA